jgi:hypothetical protein
MLSPIVLCDDFLFVQGSAFIIMCVIPSGDDVVSLYAEVCSGVVDLGNFLHLLVNFPTSSCG